MLHLLLSSRRKKLTIKEVGKRPAAARKGLDLKLHERAFGRAMRKLREEHNMSQEQLAARANVTVQLVARVERGCGGGISVLAVCRIARAFKLLPHEFMKHYQNAVKEADSGAAWW
jgi:DNA-binding XRE family transcriptional regulator